MIAFLISRREKTFANCKSLSGLSKIQEFNTVASKSGPSGSKNPLVVELEEATKPKDKKKQPEFTLYKNNKVNRLSAEIKLPGVISGRDLFLDVGEDRLVLNSRNYELDIFIPIKLDGARTEARFVKDNQILSIDTPIIL